MLTKYDYRVLSALEEKNYPRLFDLSICSTSKLEMRLYSTECIRIPSTQILYLINTNFEVKKWKCRKQEADLRE